MKLMVLTLTMLILPQSSTVPARDARVPGNDNAALRKQASGGDVNAQVQLGLAYASGDGVTADQAEAVAWFRKAADQGNAGGEYYLGEVYATGRGAPADYVEALKWLRKSADQGESRAQYNLAALYTQGLGVGKDDNEAARWMRKANEAARWMRKAADQGLAAGQFGLGSMYAHGQGVEQNTTQAAAWYRKAADQGDTPAMNNLALLLDTADPKLRNPKEAILLAARAVGAEPDNPVYLDTLASAYSEDGQPDKAAEAERLALALKPGNPSYEKALQKYQAVNSKPKPE